MRPSTLAHGTNQDHVASSHRPIHGQTSLHHLQLHGFIMPSVHSLSRLTHSLISVPIPRHPYSVASFQAPRISQQPSEPPSVKTLPTFIPDNESGIRISDDSALSLSAQLDKDQSEMVCFGMVSAYMLYHKSIFANIYRSRPSPLDVSGNVHVKFHQRFQSK
jgi:hypothetical protein